MELRMSFNDFIKVKSIFKINDLSGEVLDYTINNEEITGILGITGTYYLDDLKTTHTISEEIPFNFVFTDSNFIVNDVDCVNLDYELVDGRGLEVNFDIVLEYEQDETKEEILENTRTNDIVNNDETIEVEEKVDNLNKERNDDPIQDVLEVEEANIDELTVESETRTSEITVEEEIEDIKEKITDEITSKLEKSLSYKDDNLPTEETFLNKIEERKSCIKVCYYTNEQELEKICRNNNVSLNHVFATNSNNNISNTRRIIIDE